MTWRLPVSETSSPPLCVLLTLLHSHCLSVSSTTVLVPQRAFLLPFPLWGSTQRVAPLSNFLWAFSSVSCLTTLCKCPRTPPLCLSLLYLTCFLGTVFLLLEMQVPRGRLHCLFPCCIPSGLTGT